MISFDDVLKAEKNIREYIYKTPLLRAESLDEIMGCRVYLKLENLQKTGSFKLRGALNAVLNLTEEEKEKGVFTYSTGNHAKAIAHSAKVLGTKARIYVPAFCDESKLEAVKAYGPEIERVLGMLSEEQIERIKTEEGLSWVHPCADKLVQAGQGTIGLEILEDLSEVTAVVSPIGGGGLISGIATAVKGRDEYIKVFGVENVQVPRYFTCLKECRQIHLEKLGDTIADATRGIYTYKENFDAISARVDQITLVNDDAIKKAMKALVQYAHVVAEPSSCMGMAAALQGQLDVKKEDNVVFVLSGGNNNIKILGEILKEG